MTFDAHRFLGPKALGLVALVTTGIAGLLAGGASSAFAQTPCEPPASAFALPSANWTCDGGSLTVTGATSSMALATNPASPDTNATTEFRVDVNTNEAVTLGVGMNGPASGDVITFVPNGVSLDGVAAQPGIYFSKLSDYATDPETFVTPQQLPAVGDTATLMVQVDSAGNISVYLDGSLAATVSDPTYTPGSIGVGINAAQDPGAHATFSNFVEG